MTERYRCKINLSNDPKEIAQLALECISELSGDKLFYDANVKKIA